MRPVLEAACALASFGLLLSGCATQEVPADQPELLLMTSLPLRVGEAGIEEQLQGMGDPAPAYQRLSHGFAITSLDNIEALNRRDGGLLLMAQPRALAPTELVALDAWLRQGGNAVILADPALQWPSKYPIGDTRRPLYTSLLSPLFTHWGIELVLPTEDAARRVELTIGRARIETVTPGMFLELGDGQGGAATCTLRSSGVLASCIVGKGRAILLADADLLDDRFWADDAPPGLFGNRGDNMDLIETLLLDLRK